MKELTTSFVLCKLYKKIKKLSDNYYLYLYSKRGTDWLTVLLLLLLLSRAACDNRKLSQDLIEKSLITVFLFFFFFALDTCESHCWEVLIQFVLVCVCNHIIDAPPHPSSLKLFFFFFSFSSSMARYWSAAVWPGPHWFPTATTTTTTTTTTDLVISLFLFCPFNSSSSSSPTVAKGDNVIRTHTHF